MNDVPLIEMPGRSRHPAIADRYEAKVDRRGADECWPWIGERDYSGYGTIRVRKRRVLAHRLGFQLRHGWLPPAVRHSCDNPPCQNPAHWRPGTQSDNVRDRTERGRAAKGSGNGRSVLTETIVIEARRRHSEGESMRALGREFGVSNVTMLKAIRGQTWGAVSK